MSAEKCGTRTGYYLHRKVNEPACQPCKDAIAAYKREYLSRTPAVQAKQNAYTKAHDRALLRLKDAHPAEFARLLDEERSAS
jgi:hypothetical protein